MFNDKLSDNEYLGKEFKKFRNVKLSSKKKKGKAYYQKVINNTLLGDHKKAEDGTNISDLNHCMVDVVSFWYVFARDLTDSDPRKKLLKRETGALYNLIGLIYKQLNGGKQTELRKASYLFNGIDNKLRWYSGKRDILNGKYFSITDLRKMISALNYMTYKDWLSKQQTTSVAKQITAISDILLKPVDSDFTDYKPVNLSKRYKLYLPKEFIDNRGVLVPQNKILNALKELREGNRFRKAASYRSIGDEPYHVRSDKEMYVVVLKELTAQVVMTGNPYFQNCKMLFNNYLEETHLSTEDYLAIPSDEAMKVEETQ